MQSRIRCKSGYELQMGSGTEGNGCDLFQNIFAVFFWGNRLKVW
jgi:hypothetical protein